MAGKRTTQRLRLCGPSSRAIDAHDEEHTAGGTAYVSSPGRNDKKRTPVMSPERPPDRRGAAGLGSGIHGLLWADTTCLVLVRPGTS